MEILFCEFPLERSGDQLVMLLKAKDAFLESRQRREIIRGERLSFQDRKVDFDLVKPAGVDGAMNENKIGVFFLEPQDALGTTMR